MYRFICASLICFNVFSGGLIVTTTQNVKYIVDQLLVGVSDIDVFAITKGAQDPHYLTAKPSYTVKLSKADLLISIGFGLEEGWLPLVQRSSRNPKILDEQNGHFVLGKFIHSPIDVPEKLSRADGDVHAEGNPHFTQSPKRVLEILPSLSQRLASLYPSHAQKIAQNRILLEKRLNDFIKEVEKENVKGVKLITYHKTLNYFFNDFGVVVSEYLEPKPGIPPSASHILSLLKLIETQKINLVLIENYYPDEVSSKLKTKFSNLTVKRVAVEVDGDTSSRDLFSVYQNILDSLKLARN